MVPLQPAYRRLANLFTSMAVEKFNSSCPSLKLVLTAGGAISMTLTDEFFNCKRRDCVYECTAALVAQ